MQNALFDTEEYSHGYNVTSTLGAKVLYIVDAISSQDKRGAWTRVVARRIARDTTFSKKDVEKAILDMLDHDVLFISCIEIWDGFFQMVYVMTTTPLEENVNENVSQYRTDRLYL